MRKLLKTCITYCLLLCLMLTSVLGGLTPTLKVHAASTTGNFIHPGLLHTQTDFLRMSQMVSNRTEPYLSGFNALSSSTYCNKNWTPRATATITRGGTGDNVGLLYVDIARAYQCALYWKITGDTGYGNTARDILNAWSSTLTTVTGNADRYLASGLYGYELANAAEIMRDYPGFNLSAMQNMLLTVFYEPLCERFLWGNSYGSDHNDACITNYWANWDLANMAATVAIGIFCDRRDIYNKGLEYFKSGAGNGSIYNAIPYLYSDGTAQWQESGRDQAHSLLGIGLMACICEMAWSQGDDLYGYADNRFMAACEYVAKYNLGNSVPFTTYEYKSGQGSYQSQSVISEASRGEVRPIWAMIYNHYAVRKGYSVPYIRQMVQTQGTEGGPATHASSFDQLGFGTLTYTLNSLDTSASTIDNDVPSGTYRIISKQSGLALGASATGNNSAVTLQTASLTDTKQQWNISSNASGVYTLTNVASGRVLDIASGSYDNGAKAIIYNSNGGNNQKFALIKTRNNAYRISPLSSTKSVEVKDAATNNGAAIIQYRYWETTNQQWELIPVSVNSSLESYNYPGYFIRHYDYQAKLQQNVSPSADKQFHIVQGLADPSAISFQSVNYPGRYLCVRSDGTVYLDSNDGSSTFAQNASFRRVTGLAGHSTYSYQMWSNSSKYLRHYNFVLRADSGSGSLFQADASFYEVTP